MNSIPLYQVFIIAIGCGFIGAAFRRAFAEPKKYGRRHDDE